LRLIRTKINCNKLNISAPSCHNQPRTLNKVKHLKLDYSLESKQAKLSWWKRGDKVLTDRPINDNSDNAAYDFIDYDTETEEPQRNEDLPSGVSFAEDLSNYLAAWRGSCQNDSLLMIWKNDNSLLTSIKFPSGNLTLTEERETSFTWNQELAPKVKISPKLKYTEMSQNLTLEFEGWNYWNYKWASGIDLRRGDKILSFLTYLCVRTRWDWDETTFNSNPYYGVSKRTLNRSTWPKFAKRLFQLNGHSAEQILIKIVDTYWSYFDHIQHQYYVKQYDYNFNVIKEWIDATFLPYTPNMARGMRQTFSYDEQDQINRLSGSEFQNIVEPLKESCIIKELTICFCNDNNIVANVNHLKTKTFNTIYDFNKFKTVAASQEMYRIKTLGTCMHCATAYRYVQYFVGDTTWFLYFEPSLHKYIEHLNIEELPKELQVRDAFSSKTFATFDLGYVSFIKYNEQISTAQYQFGCCTYINKQIKRLGRTRYVSFQLLWGIWYYYDSYNFGPLIEINNPLDIIMQEKLAFAAAVYFRR